LNFRIRHRLDAVNAGVTSDLAVGETFPWTFWRGNSVPPIEFQTHQYVPRTRSDHVIRKFMMGLAAAGLVSMAPMTASAHMQDLSSTKSIHKKTVTSMPMGSFKYKSSKHKTPTYGSGKSSPQ
jgi:hypothetical protein